MMMELDTITQPYPSMNPWLDLSPYLANNLRPYAAGSVGCLIEGNLIHYDIHVAATGATPGGSQTLLEGIPSAYRPAAIPRAWAIAGQQQMPVEFRNGGQVIIPAWSDLHLRSANNISMTLTARRRVP